MQRISAILIFISFLILTSCSKQVNIISYIDQKQALTLKINKTNNQIDLSYSESIKIEPNSEKFKKLITWCANNQGNWNDTPKLSVVKFAVWQLDFILLCNQDYVSVFFRDKKGNGHQYYKSIKKGELDFLIN